MSAIRTLIQQIKALELEYLNEQELDTLKEEIIKLLVDIQMQMDINQKMQEAHLTMDEVQMQVMQQSEKHIEEESVEDKRNEGETKNAMESEVSVLADESDKETNYKEMLREEISDEVISIYTGSDSENGGDKECKEESVAKVFPENKQEGVSRIIFSINDKFRIVKRLFGNNSKEFEYFIERLNGMCTREEAERWIEENAAKWGWDGEVAEYQILVKQNLRRFRRL